MSLFLKCLRHGKESRLQPSQDQEGQVFVEVGSGPLPIVAVEAVVDDLAVERYSHIHLVEEEEAATMMSNCYIAVSLAVVDGDYHIVVVVGFRNDSGESEYLGVFGLVLRCSAASGPS